MSYHGAHYQRGKTLTLSQASRRLDELKRAVRLELDGAMETESEKDIVAGNVALKVLRALGRFDRRMKRGTLI